MWIKREISPSIRKAALSRPAILLTGARQTGKSSLLEKTFPQYNYVSLDWPDKTALARENGAYFLEKYKAPLIIDEIQYAPELLRFLKIAIDKNRNRYGRYILTGSQKFSLMKGVRESLSGRISILECHPLSAGEIQAYKKQKLSANKTLEWMIQGGYPEVHAQNLDPERFYADYTATFLERDVRQMLNVKDLSVFNKFLRLLALRSGQVLSMNPLAAALGVSLHTVKSWISVLEASNIVFLLRPFHNNYGKRLLKSPKLYFLDTGLLCFLTGLSNKKALEDSALLGAFFETFCFGQFVRRFHNRGRPADIYFFRDSQGNEVDFIRPEGNKLFLYECKWSFQQGKAPKNIIKFRSLVSAGSLEKKPVKMSKIITNTDTRAQIEKSCQVTNFIDF